ncbi:uncharacterized protein SAPINGB_P004334 [Magnusiomyces paraingens]|uniref:Uncharacterized protein n=1 Tax=Magnusiomyces paraingens TaxID=2606893 RepID=A0A5E8BUZ4_9ASCO|nr:uncharacterized protein SAPINGB_P004334 [Saprochaete ingens]VVT54931.1 unnamed protein product [Saprochaete ingens]
MSSPNGIVLLDLDTDDDDDEIEITNVASTTPTASDTFGLASSSSSTRSSQDDDIAITNVRQNNSPEFISSHNNNNDNSNDDDDDDEITVTSTVVRPSPPAFFRNSTPSSRHFHNHHNNNNFNSNSNNTNNNNNNQRVLIYPNLNFTITGAGTYALHLPDGNTIQVATRRFRDAANANNNNDTTTTTTTSTTTTTTANNNQWTARGRMPPVTFSDPSSRRQSMSPHIVTQLIDDRRIFIEQQQLRLAQLLSSELYSQQANANAPTLATVKKMPPPPPTRDGFSHGLKKTNKYACALCGTRLAIGFPKEGHEKQGEESRYRGINDTHRSLSKRIFFSTCGHIFCGWCVSRIVNRKTLPEEVRKQNYGAKRQKGNKKGKDLNPEPDPPKNQIPLMQMYIPPSCNVEGCQRQFRNKSFKEIFL